MTQNKRPFSILLLILLYSIFTLIALWRATQYASFDILTMGVLPVLVGLLIQARWTKVVLFFHLGLQTLVFVALTTTAVIAYQITPEDVKLEFAGYNISITLAVVVAITLLAIQWWAALHHKTRAYLNTQGISTTA